VSPTVCEAAPVRPISSRR